MGFKPVDADTPLSRVPVSHAEEVRDTIIKSGLSGVAATVLAVTIWSPAGLGGMIGTSVASSTDAQTAASDAVGRLAPFPTPISEVELDYIKSTLHHSQRSMRLMRQSTDDAIAHIRAVAQREGLAAPMGLRGVIGGGMDVTEALMAPAPLVAPAVVARTAEPAPMEVAAVAPTPAPITVSYAAPLASSGAVVTYIGGDEYNSAPDPNMELASLLLAF